MPAPKLTTLFRATLAGAVLFIMAGLMLSVTQAWAETLKDRAVASSLAEVTLEPGAKLLVILENGEKVKVRATGIAEGALSIYTYPDGISKLSESEIFQIFQVKGRTRARGALYGAIVGAAAAVPLARLTSLLYDQSIEGLQWVGLFALAATVCVPSGAAIGALVVSGEEKKLVFQNPAVSRPPASKTGLINYRDGRLSFGVPSVYLRPDNFDGFRVKPFERRNKHIELVSVDF